MKPIYRSKYSAITRAQLSITFGSCILLFATLVYYDEALIHLSESYRFVLMASLPAFLFAMFIIVYSKLGAFEVYDSFISFRERGVYLGGVQVLSCKYETIIKITNVNNNLRILIRQGEEKIIPLKGLIYIDSDNREVQITRVISFIKGRIETVVNAGDEGSIDIPVITSYRPRAGKVIVKDKLRLPVHIRHR